MPNNNPSGLGAFDLPLRLPGQYFDRETGLHYNYFRDYDPSLGIYKQSDPIGLRVGPNTYAYVGSAPLLSTDVFGLVTNPPICFKLGECVDPPVDPTPGGPKPSPLPPKGPKPPRVKDPTFCSKYEPEYVSGLPPFSRTLP